MALKLLILIAAIAGSIAYLGWLASPPPGVSFDDTCQPRGTRATFSASRNSDEYWSHQLAAASLELKSLEEAPERSAQFKAAIAPAMANVDRLIAESDAMMEKFYLEHPSLGPSPFSPAAQQAKQLRAAADAVEQTEMENWLEMTRTRRMAILERCRKLIVEKHQR